MADILEAFEVADMLPDGERQKAIIAAADRAIVLAGTEAIALSDSGSLAESRPSNPGHWLAHRANVSKTRGRRIVASARLADRFDAVAEAIDEGVLTDDHMTALKLSLPGNRTTFRVQMFERDHKMLIDIARDYEFPAFKKSCEAWIGLCEDAGPTQRPLRTETSA